MHCFLDTLFTNLFFIIYNHSPFCKISTQTKTLYSFLNLFRLLLTISPHLIELFWLHIYTFLLSNFPALFSVLIFQIPILKLLVTPPERIPIQRCKQGSVFLQEEPSFTKQNHFKEQHNVVFPFPFYIAVHLAPPSGCAWSCVIRNHLEHHLYLPLVALNATTA